MDATTVAEFFTNDDDWERTHGYDGERLAPNAVAPQVDAPAPSGAADAGDESDEDNFQDTSQGDDAPAESPPEPVGRSVVPVPESTAPVPESAAPVPESAAPVPESAAPVPESTAPVTESAASVSESAAPPSGTPGATPAGPSDATQMYVPFTQKWPTRMPMQLYVSPAIFGKHAKQYGDLVKDCLDAYGIKVNVTNDGHVDNEKIPYDWEYKWILLVRYKDENRRYYKGSTSYMWKLCLCFADIDAYKAEEEYYRDTVHWYFPPKNVQHSAEVIQRYADRLLSDVANFAARTRGSPAPQPAAPEPGAVSGSQDGDDSGDDGSATNGARTPPKEEGEREGGNGDDDDGFGRIQLERLPPQQDLRIAVQEEFFGQHASQYGNFLLDCIAAAGGRATLQTELTDPDNEWVYVCHFDDETPARGRVWRDAKKVICIFKDWTGHESGINPTEFVRSSLGLNANAHLEILFVPKRPFHYGESVNVPWGNGTGTGTIKIIDEQRHQFIVDVNNQSQLYDLKDLRPLPGSPFDKDVSHLMEVIDSIVRPTANQWTSLAAVPELAAPPSGPARAPGDRSAPAADAGAGPRYAKGQKVEVLNLVGNWIPGVVVEEKKNNETRVKYRYTSFGQDFEYTAGFLDSEIRLPTNTASNYNATGVNTRADDAENASSGMTFQVGQTAPPASDTGSAPAANAGVPSFRVGDEVEARYTVDGKWYEAKIVRIDEKKITVVFPDYGNTEELPFDGVRALAGPTPSNAPYFDNNAPPTFKEEQRVEVETLNHVWVPGTVTETTERNVFVRLQNSGLEVPCDYENVRLPIKSFTFGQNVRAWNAEYRVWEEGLIISISRVDSTAKLRLAAGGLRVVSLANVRPVSGPETVPAGRAAPAVDAAGVNTVTASGSSAGVDADPMFGATAEAPTDIQSERATMVFVLSKNLQKNENIARKYEAWLEECAACVEMDALFKEDADDALDIYVETVDLEAQFIIKPEDEVQQSFGKSKTILLLCFTGMNPKSWEEITRQYNKTAKGWIFTYIDIWKSKNPPERWLHYRGEKAAQVLESLADLIKQDRAKHPGKWLEAAKTARRARVPAPVNGAVAPEKAGEGPKVDMRQLKVGDSIRVRYTATGEVFPVILWQLEKGYWLAKKPDSTLLCYLVPGEFSILSVETQGGSVTPASAPTAKPVSASAPPPSGQTAPALASFTKPESGDWIDGFNRTLQGLTDFAKAVASPQSAPAATAAALPGPDRARAPAPSPREVPAATTPATQAEAELQKVLVYVKQDDDTYPISYGIERLPKIGGPELDFQPVYEGIDPPADVRKTVSCVFVFGPATENAAAGATLLTEKASAYRQCIIVQYRTSEQRDTDTLVTYEQLSKHHIRNCAGMFVLYLGHLTTGLFSRGSIILPGSTFKEQNSEQLAAYNKTELETIREILLKP